jgi:hypothetical protein
VHLDVPSAPLTARAGRAGRPAPSTDRATPHTPTREASTVSRSRPTQPTPEQLEQARRAVDRTMGHEPPHVRETRAQLVAEALADGHKIRLDD